jgi:3-oxoacyl-[acyl-carrier-protein] synthase II
MKRVVITGMGVVSPLGNSLPIFWDALLEGKSSVKQLSKLPAQSFKGNMLAAEVEYYNNNFKEESYALQYAIEAAEQSLIHANLPINSKERNNNAVIIGTTSANQDILERTIDTFNITSTEQLFSSDAAKMFAKVRPNRLSSLLAQQINFGGSNMVIPTACAAGNYAISTAYALIKAGKTSVAIAGGADSFTRSCYTIFYRLGGMTHQDCRPFDKNRTGMVVGEGAGMLVLEELEHAKSRNANILAEVKGFGLSCDAYHRVAPDPIGKGAAIAMEKALQCSAIRKSDISLVSAHGTGTHANDIQEARALASVFEEQLPNIPISGLKSMLGHCMGAASSFEAIAGVMSLQTQRIPPTINTIEVDPCFPVALDIIPNTYRESRIDHILTNAFGFGGNICSIVLSRYSSN